MMKNFTITNRTKYGYDIFDISGEISLDDFEGIHRYVGENITAGNVKIIINLEKVRRINSSGLSLLIKLAKDFFSKKFSMHIMNASEDIMTVIKATGVKSIFQFIRDENSLIRKLDKEHLDSILEEDI